ncbi:hypothetical protein EYC98_21200 [Halieaceae bacterium IMCC14734]|uniref:VPLPA-CTERM sorting domain-containing protein n=1 Tax=Candidatus Litorirhabdus singularis TaxID=2518993 RepID=A0ABT3TM73_9GAMM|nr:VPLPA-CTERM sorting domain-containing protein [Candidatus Litorirhabdus singularis]MCX2983385.1 hypothetical protein [Candidatus Litorirhabdus singularis]
MTIEVRAATVVSNGLYVVGITNFEFNSDTYNVVFEKGCFTACLNDGLYPFFGEISLSAEARDQINILLEGVHASRVGSTAGDEYFIPTGNSGLIWGTVGGEKTVFGWASRSGNVIPNSQTVSAAFHVVPIPAAAWLFASALLGLGVLKRKVG